MLGHIVSITLWSIIEYANNFRQLDVMMDVLVNVFNDLNSINVVIIITLSNCNINNPIFTNININNVCTNDDELEFVDQVAIVIIDNVLGIIETGSGGSTKPLMISRIVACKAANGASNVADVGNLNGNYLDCCNVQLTMRGELLFPILIERNDIADEMIGIWKHLATNTSKKDRITNPTTLAEPHGDINVVKIHVQDKILMHVFEVYTEQKFYFNLYTTECKATDNFVFEEHRVILRNPEARIEYLEDRYYFINYLGMQI